MIEAKGMNVKEVAMEEMEDLPEEIGVTNEMADLPDTLEDITMFMRGNTRFVDKTVFACSSEISTRTPENYGEWDGEKGNSTWHPDRDYVPPEKSKNPEKPYSNPNNLSWGEILDKYGLAGIKFKEGFPVFAEISNGTVEIDDFETGGSDAKDRNFKRADIAMAKQRGCAVDEVRKWRNNNNNTWHECEDKRTMQLVPHEVHANVTHDGGRSQ